MNKQLLIVLLAVCLVSTHAFVKRDAALPTAKDLQEQVNITKNKIEELINNLTEQVGKDLNPEAIKENFINFVDAASKAVDALKPTTEAPKPAA